MKLGRGACIGQDEENTCMQLFKDVWGRDATITDLMATTTTMMQAY